MLENRPVSSRGRHKGRESSRRCVGNTTTSLGGIDLGVESGQLSLPTEPLFLKPRYDFPVEGKLLDAL